MTPEFGAASQLEKIDMLDFADVVAINKFERRGAEDALRDVAPPAAPQPRGLPATPEDMPVFGTVAARFNDDGVTALYQHLRGLLADHGLAVGRRRARPGRRPRPRPGCAEVVPAARGRATWPRSPRRCAATTRDTDAAGRAPPVAGQQTAGRAWSC